MIQSIRFFWAIISLMGLFLLIKTAIPTLPSLGEKKVIMCEKDIFSNVTYKYLGQGSFYCKTTIKLGTLYNAESITVRIKADQNIKLKVELVPKKRELFYSNTLEFTPEDNYEDSLTFRFDQFGIPKINHLTRDIDGIILYFSDLNEDKIQNLEIKELFLQ